MTSQRKIYFGHLVLSSIPCYFPMFAKQWVQEREMDCITCFSFTGQHEGLQTLYTVSDNWYFKYKFKVHEKGCSYILAREHYHDVFPFPEGCAWSQFKLEIMSFSLIFGFHLTSQIEWCKVNPRASNRGRPGHWGWFHMPESLVLRHHTRARTTVIWGTAWDRTDPLLSTVMGYCSAESCDPVVALPQNTTFL